MTTMNLVSTSRTTSSTRPRLRMRRAGIDDATLLADFVSSSAEWYRSIVDDTDMDEHDVDEQWAVENLARRDFYIGHAEDEPVGTVSLQYFGDYAYLGYIYLDVDHVGKGFGQRLMRFAEGMARLRGSSGLALIAHPEAVWAKRAYLKYGFEIVARRKQDVLRWQNGVLRPYYEEGFELYLHHFESANGRAHDTTSVAKGATG